jgi:hypothetical protein
MPVTQEQLDRFHRYASAKIREASEDLEWDDLVSSWQRDHSGDRERAEINAILRQSIREMEAGLTVDAYAATEEIARDLGLSTR